MDSMRKAVFLDRDGTIIEDCGNINSPGQVIFYQHTIKALKILSRNYLLFIVSNQVGVAQGDISVEQLETVNRHIKSFLAEHGIDIVEFFICPHGKDAACECRKPSPYFLNLAGEKYKLNLSESYIIGDHPSDVLCGLNAGAKPIYLLTGHGAKHIDEVMQKTLILPDILSAAEWIEKEIEIEKIYGPELNEKISEFANELKDDNIGIIPTETVYGLAANALSPYAVAKVFEVKKRPAFDPLIVHTNSIENALKLVENPPQTAFKLMKRFWPGPLTLVLRKRSLIPDIVTSGLPTVAVRIPRHPLTLKLIEKCSFPLAAPSANPFSKTSPTKIENLHKDLLKSAKFAADGGKCTLGIESTVIAFDDDENPVLLRHGALPTDEIEKACGRELKTAEKGKIIAPGQLKKHYSPETELQIITSCLSIPCEFRKGSALLSVFPCSTEDFSGFRAVKILSENCDFREAASKLFETLHELDEMRLNKIYVILAPESHLGIAINDRLRRASEK